MHSYTYSVMQLHKLRSTRPYEVHMIFGYGHKESKVYKLRDAGLGHDPPDSEYYNPAGGVLSFELVLPYVPTGFTDWSVEDLAHTEVSKASPAGPLHRSLMAHLLDLAVLVAVGCIKICGA